MIFMDLLRKGKSAMDISLQYDCSSLYKSKCIKDIKEDFLKTLEVSQEITLEEMKKIKWWQKFLRAILRAFAPLM